MNLPSVRSYLRSVLRYWYVIVACMIIGVGASLWLRDPSPEKITVGDVVFTVVADERGQESGGTARLAEDQLAVQRLTTYATVALSQARTQQILSDAGVDAPVDSMWTTLTAPQRFVIRASAGGVVSVQLANKSQSDEAARELVRQVQEVVAGTAVQLDAQQATPSIVGTPVLSDPQTILATAPSAGPSPLELAVPLSLAGSVGLGLVFLLGWRYRLVEDRRDLEERLELSVLGEVAPRREEDLLVVAQSLARASGDSAAPRVLLARAPGAGQVSAVVEGVLGANRGLTASSLPVATAKLGEAHLPPSESPWAPASTVPELVDLTEPEGLSRGLIAAAPSADLIGIVVRYGSTPMRDLEQMLVRLSDASSTPLRAIGVTR